MRRSSRGLVLVVAGVLAAAAASRAGDVPADVKAAIDYFEKYAGKAKDDGKFAGLVGDLAATQDPAAAERIAKILDQDKSLEHQQIAADSLGDFKKTPAGREAAGKALVKALQKGGYEEDVDIQIVDGIGKLPYVEGCLPVCEVLSKSSSPWYMVRCVRCLGNLKDLHALPTLLEILEKFPPAMKWGDTGGGETKVDTGASGDADQKAAEAKYNEDHKGDHKKGKPPVMFKAYIQELKLTVHKITLDETIESAVGLRLWMEAHAEQLTKLGIEIPKYHGPTRKDEDGKKK